MMKFTVSVCLGILLCIHVFAVDITGAIHVDTYAGEPVAGISFEVEERIFSATAIKASLQYFTAHAYEAQCLLTHTIKNVLIGGGIAYSIDNSAKNIIVPGIGITTAVKLPWNLGFVGSAILSLAPANLYKAYSFRTNTRLLYSTPNADAFLQYTVKQSAEAAGITHGLLLQVEAFEKGVPFTLTLGFGTDFLTATEDDTSIEFEAHITGGFAIITSNAGTYFLQGKVTPLTYRNIAIPFEIYAGTRISF